jgi:DNA primase
MSSTILDIAHEHLRRVKPSGNENIMAVCPFHSKANGQDEKNPSFSMNIYSGLWYCHSCHCRGNLYTFLRDLGMPRADIEFHFKDALEEAAKWLPAKPYTMNPIEPVKGEPLEESFLGLFDFCPQLLIDEGFSQEVLRKFDIGFDEKHMRITFPLRDLRGRLVGISGRSVNGTEPRYKVYDWEYKDFGLPERRTEKRALLYNAHSILPQFALEHDPGSRYVVVVEGFKATLRVAQAGIHNVVALLGSYMANEQQWVIERLGCPVLLMLDNNDAGRRGQLDAGKRLVKSIPRLYVVGYSTPQPSDLHLQAIPDALLGAQPFVSWFLQQSLQP